jgi:hypothetical protein
MKFEQDLCKILYHDWVKREDWTYCDRCNRKWDFHKDWTDYCLRSDRKIMGHLLTRCNSERPT